MGPSGAGGNVRGGGVNTYLQYAETEGPLSDATVFVDVSNVRGWIEKSDRRPSPSDIPVFRSPFDVAWYECSFPSDRLSVGAYWLSLPVDLLPEIKAAQEARGAVVDWEPSDKCVTLESVQFFALMRGKSRVFHVGTYYVETGEHGEALNGIATCDPRDCACRLHSPEAPDPAAFQWIMLPSLYAVGLLNCKNVDAIDVDVPEKVRRARIRRGAHPGVRYKVLRVRPMTTRKTSGPALPGEQGVMPLHLSRGHFKDYRDSGLFGRQHGVYWWAPHVRGSAANGEIKKTYEIKDGQALNGHSE